MTTAALTASLRDAALLLSGSASDAAVDATREALAAEGLRPDDEIVAVLSRINFGQPRPAGPAFTGVRVERDGEAREIWMD